MDLGIKNKVMIVTGGAKGIGEGISRCIAEEGAIPVMAGRSRDAGETLMNDLKALTRKLGIENIIIFSGFIVEEKLPDYYRMADFKFPTWIFSVLGNIHLTKPGSVNVGHSPREGG